MRRNAPPPPDSPQGATTATSASEEKLQTLCKYVETVKTRLAEGQTERFLTIPEQLHAHQIVYETSTRKYEHCSAHLYALHGEHIAVYLGEQFGELKAIEDRRGSDEDEPERRMRLIQTFAAVWTRFKIFNKWMFKIFWYLNRFFVPHQGTPTLQQSGINAFSSIIVRRLRTDIKACLVLNGIDVKTLLSTAEAFQAVNHADENLVETIVVGAFPTKDARVQEEILAVLARFTESNGIHRLLEKPGLLKAVMDCATTLSFPSASSLSMGTPLYLTQILLNLSTASGPRRSMLPKSHPAMNYLLQNATTSSPASDTKTAALKALKNAGCTQSHIKCFEMMTTLCLAGDERHGVQSKFYVIPTALLIVIHETLCPCATRRGPGAVASRQQPAPLSSSASTH